MLYPLSYEGGDWRIPGRGSRRRGRVRGKLELNGFDHATLECQDIVKTRRFYEEILGIECIQTSSCR